MNLGRSSKYLLILATIIMVTLIYLKWKNILQIDGNKLLQNVTTSFVCPKFSIKERECLENGWDKEQDPHLLELIRCEWMNPPSKGPLKLRGSAGTTAGKGVIVDNILEQKKGQYFIYIHTFTHTHIHRHTHV